MQHFSSSILTNDLSSLLFFQYSFTRKCILAIIFALVVVCRYLSILSIKSLKLLTSLKELTQRFREQGYSFNISQQKIQEIFSCLVKMFKEISYRNISELSKLGFYQLPEI